MLLPEDICYGCGNDHRACTCARPAPVTQRAPVAEPLRPEVAHTLTAFLTRAAERGGDVAITHGSTAIHMPAAMALSLDTSAAGAAAVSAERERAASIAMRVANEWARGEHDRTAPVLLAVVGACERIADEIRRGEGR